MTDAHAVFAPTGEVVTPYAPSTVAPTQYPSAWFNLKKSKPVLSINLTTNDLTTVRNQIKGTLSSQELNVNVANTFLFYFAETVKDTLSD